MRIIITLLIILFSVQIFVLLPASPALAVGLPELQIDELNPGFDPAYQCNEEGEKGKICYPWIGQYITKIYNYAIGIVAILATVVMMIGGVVWITAGGNTTRVGEAKAWIGASLTGLVLAMFSYTILYLINPELTIMEPIKVEHVSEVPTIGCCETPGGACSNTTEDKCRQMDIFKPDHTCRGGKKCVKDDVGCCVLFKSFGNKDDVVCFNDYSNEECNEARESNSSFFSSYSYNKVINGTKCGSVTEFNCK